MELKEKIRRIEEVVKMNNEYVREIWKSLKTLARHMRTNAGGIQKITEALMKNLDIDVETEDKKKSNGITDKKELLRMYL